MISSKDQGTYHGIPWITVDGVVVGLSCSVWLKLGTTRVRVSSWSISTSVIYDPSMLYPSVGNDRQLARTIAMSVYVTPVYI